MPRIKKVKVKLITVWHCSRCKGIDPKWNSANHAICFCGGIMIKEKTEEYSAADLVRRSIVRCQSCELHKVLGVRPVPFYGPTPNKIAVIAECPGWEELNQRKPLVGPAGQCLRGALKEVGFNPDDLTYMNSLSCPEIPMGGLPTANHLKACRGNVRAQLGLIRPRFVLLCGNTALQLIKPGTKITRMAGKPVFGKNITWMPILHPSYILRNESSPRVRDPWVGDIKAFYKLAMERDGNEI